MGVKDFNKLNSIINELRAENVRLNKEIRSYEHALAEKAEAAAVWEGRYREARQVNQEWERKYLEVDRERVKLFNEAVRNEEILHKELRLYKDTINAMLDRKCEGCSDFLTQGESQCPIMILSKKLVQ